MEMSLCRSASSLVVGTNYGDCRPRHPLCPLCPHQFFRRKTERSQVLVQASKAADNVNQASETNVKKTAHLTGRRKQRVILTDNNINDDEESFRKLHPMSEFLSHSSGAAETALFNRDSYQTVVHLGSAGSNNTYRCTLHTIQLLNFEITPVCDIRVIPTPKDCTMEMLSCKFQGSVDNDRFSAFMRNHITWDENCSEPYFDVEIILEMSLQMDEMPFSLLPVSTVEIPGNLTIQALVDNLVRQLIQEIVKSYEKWLLRLRCQDSPAAVEKKHLNFKTDSDD